MADSSDVATSTAGDESGVIREDRKNRSGRLYRKIRKQMEFYFGDHNLLKDRFLSKLLEKSEDGYVELEVFKTFNKIKELTNEIEDVAKAISCSELLELNSDKTKVRRRVPLIKTDYDDCTIYVERLPPHADHKWIKDTFQNFGRVAYVSLPKFKTGKIKGFAFVEFETLESANKACEAYKSEDEESEEEKEEEESDGSKAKKSEKTQKAQEARLPKGKESFKKKGKKWKTGVNKQPQDKVSKSGKESQNDGEVKMDAEHGKITSKGCKRKMQSSDSEDATKKLKMNTLSDSEAKSAPETASEANADEILEKKPNALRETLKISDSEISSTNDSNYFSTKKDIKKNAGNNSATSTTVKSDISENLSTEKSISDQDEEVDVTGKDSEMESEEVCDSSTNAKTKRKRKKKKKHDAEKVHLRVISKAEWKRYRNLYLSQQRAAMAQIKKFLMLNSQTADTSDDLKSESSVTKQHSEKTEFQPGVILKINMQEAITRPADIKTQIRSSLDVAYVDASEGSADIFVRCNNPESALSILNDRKLNHLGAVSIVEGEEETNYWIKLQKDREAAYKKPRQKKRGRDKIAAKSTKLMEEKNTHIYFDE